MAGNKGVVIIPRIIINIPAGDIGSQISNRSLPLENRLEYIVKTLLSQRSGIVQELILEYIACAIVAGVSGVQPEDHRSGRDSADKWARLIIHKITGSRSGFGAEDSGKPEIDTGRVDPSRVLLNSVLFKVITE